jgi:integrase
LENRTKPNERLFPEYYDLVGATLSATYAYETKRLLEKFRASIVEYPPSIELAMSFLNRYRRRSDNTKAKYFFILSGFFRWYTGAKFPVKIKQPKMLPQYVPKEEINRLLDTLRTKKTHKKKIERDILLVETFIMTGLRRGELAKLKVRDLHLNVDHPVLIVRGGKGKKDRTVGLNTYITNRLQAFTKNKSPEESVFGLAPKSISGKIRIWADKAGVPDLHAHSLRHYVGTTLFQRRANPRAIQAMLGHESLETTMLYAAVIGEDAQETAQLLESEPQKPEAYDPAGGVMPVVYSKEKKAR